MRRLVILVLSALAFSDAAATTRYVDNNCAHNGNGLADSCAVSDGAAGRYNSGAGIQAAITASACGDTVVIYGGGTFYTEALQTFSGADNYQQGNFLIRNKACTSGAQLTIKAADRANKPILAPLSGGLSGTDTPTISLQHSNYITLDGLAIVGQLAAYNGGEQYHAEVRYCDFSVGNMCDGNFSMLYFSDMSYAWVHNNYFHDLSTVNCTPHEAPMRTFRTQGNVYEYNTFVKGAAGSRYMRAAFDMKDCPYQDVFRFNYAQAGISVNRQAGSSCKQCVGGTNAGNSCETTSDCPGGTSCVSRTPGQTQVYGNVFVNSPENDSSQTGIATGGQAAVYFRHNTIIAGDICVTNEATDMQTTLVTAADNIVAAGGSCNWSNAAFTVITSADWGNRAGYSVDHNRYLSSLSFYGGSSSALSFSSWSTAVGGNESGSTQASSPVCSFAVGADTNYHITPSTACSTLSSSGGELGAYGAAGSTNCVGYTCSVSGGDVTPPVVSGGSPSGYFPTGTTTGTLAVTTDENATCKWGTAPGVAYASIANTFSTTGTTAHSQGLTGLASPSVNKYYVRCQDASGNADASDYVISFDVGGAECTNWQTSHPTWLWCDDWEYTSLAATAVTQNYFDSGGAGTTMTDASDQVYGGSRSLKIAYATGVDPNAYIWHSFGRSPMGQTVEINPTVDYNSVYWRFFVRNSSPWSNPTADGTDKYSRATDFVATWPAPQAMIAPIWNGHQGSNYTVVMQDPQRCTGPLGQTTVDCTTINDFAHLIFMGGQSGTNQITSVPEVGLWHCVEGYVKLNTIGVADGVETTWIDGVQDVNQTGMNWRSSYNGYGINAISLEGIWNGGAPANQSRWYDNFVISTTRIGCDVASYTCGNNLAEGGEACDGTDLAGQTCATQGFSGGTLTCASNCLSFNTSGCYTSAVGKTMQAVTLSGGTIH